MISQPTNPLPDIESKEQLGSFTTRAGARKYAFYRVTAHGKPYFQIESEGLSKGGRAIFVRLPDFALETLREALDLYEEGAK